MKKRFRNASQEPIWQALLRKYQLDQERFRSYLPEVAQELDQLFPSRRKRSHRSVLTEPERERRQKALLQLLNEKELSREDAIQALGHCATLIQDENLPTDMDRKTLLSLLHHAASISVSKITKTIKIAVGEGVEVKEVALLRGIHLHLTWSDDLVAISVSPTKFKERSKGLKFVGIGKDTASDVAQRHNDYLAEMNPHAAS